MVPYQSFKYSDSNCGTLDNNEAQGGGQYMGCNELCLVVNIFSFNFFI